MAAPSFVAASTGATDAGGAWTATCHAPGAAGRIIICQILQDGTTNAAVTFTSATNIEDLAGTDNAWTQIPGPLTNGTWAVGASEEALQFLFIGRSLSTSAPTMGGGNSTSEDLYWRFYEFDNVATVAMGADTLAEVIEGGLYYPSTGGVFDVGTTADERHAESFIFGSAATLVSATVWLKKFSLPIDDLLIEIQSDSSGSPSGSAVATLATVPAASLTTTLTPYTYTSSVSLSAATTYWLVFRRSGATHATNIYGVGALAAAPGTHKLYTAGAWSDTVEDLGHILSVTGSAVSAAATDATALDTAVTTLGPDRLALNFVAVNDDNVIPDFTGETGGDWTLAVSPYAESSGTDGAIGLQAARPSAAEFFATPAAVAIFGAGGAGEGYAESFSPAADFTVSAVQIYLAKNNSPTDNVIVQIQTDSSGSPSGSVVAQTTVSSASLPGGLALELTPLALTASLTGGTTYWLVITRSGARDTTNYPAMGYLLAGGYAGGAAKRLDSGSWTAQTFDLIHQVLGYGTINGGSASITDSDAWGVVGFALIGTTVVDTTYYPRHPAHDFGSVTNF